MGGIGTAADVGAQADRGVVRFTGGPDDTEEGEGSGEFGRELCLDLIDAEAAFRREAGEKSDDVGSESAEEHFGAGKARLGNVKAPAAADDGLFLAGVENHAASRLRRDPDADQRPVEGVIHAAEMFCFVSSSGSGLTKPLLTKSTLAPVCVKDILEAPPPGPELTH